MFNNFFKDCLDENNVIGLRIIYFKIVQYKKFLETEIFAGNFFSFSKDEKLKILIEQKTIS